MRYHGDVSSRDRTIDVKYFQLESGQYNRWTVPFRIGINKKVKIGRLPVCFAVDLQKTVVQPDAFGMDWNLRFVVIPVIPNLVKMYQGTLQLPE